MEPLEVLRRLEADASLVPTVLRDWWLRYLSDQKERYLDTLSLLREYGVGRRLLEVGSVPGQLTVLLQSLGYEVAGVDVDPDRLQEIWRKYGLSVVQADIETEPIPFAEASFDGIVFTEVLEHLRINPLHALRELVRVLKPGGHVLLSTPNITPAQRLAFFLRKQPYQDDVFEAFGKLERLGHMGHFRLYLPTEVRQMLTRLGLLILGQRWAGPHWPLARWTERILYFLHPRKDAFRQTYYALAQKPQQPAESALHFSPAAL